MIKKALTGAAIVGTVLGSLALTAPAAQAGEGRTSIGHGIKCYYVLGVQYCYKGV